MELTGKNVVITGGGSGIGRELARRFRAEGASGICVADLQADAVATVAEEVGGLGVPCDVADENAVKALVA